VLKDQGYIYSHLIGLTKIETILDLGFSETPEHKCGHVFKMDNGNYFIYPNNRIIWLDRAWTFNRIDKNPGYKIDLNIYSCGEHRGLLN
jgi:hypothetical protein